MKRTKLDVEGAWVEVRVVVGVGIGSRVSVGVGKGVGEGVAVEVVEDTGSGVSKAVRVTVGSGTVVGIGVPGGVLGDGNGLGEGGVDVSICPNAAGTVASMSGNTTGAAGGWVVWTAA